MTTLATKRMTLNPHSSTGITMAPSPLLRIKRTTNAANTPPTQQTHRRSIPLHTPRSREQQSNAQLRTYQRNGCRRSNESALQCEAFGIRQTAPNGGTREQAAHRRTSYGNFVVVGPSIALLKILNPVVICMHIEALRRGNSLPDCLIQKF